MGRTTMKAQEDQSWLWHRRLGHFNFQGLKILHQKKMMTYLPQIQAVEGASEACLQGKQHKKPFPSGTSWRAKAVLELIHTDVCGPMRTPSHEQNRYFILFIDDYSRMTWVYFMREKSEVFKVFKKFKNLVEKQSGRSIKVLRSDRGKEYNNLEFDKFYKEEGETLAKSFLGRSSLHCSLSTQQASHQGGSNMTPIEAWSGKKPSAKHLRVFGSICYVHIPTEKRHKLEEKTEKGIFLGYNTQSKGYRIYNLKTKKLIISRDVEFDEDAMWNWDEEKVERQSVMIPKETSPQQQQEEGTDQAEMERRSQQAPGSPRRPPPSEEIEEETPPRRTKLLSDIYETCNFIMLETENFETAVKHKVWVQAMEEEIKMIKKNNTWELADSQKIRSNWSKIDLQDEAECRWINTEAQGSTRSKRIFSTTRKYTETLLKKFKMERCKTVTTPLVTGEKYQKEDGSKSRWLHVQKSHWKPTTISNCHKSRYYVRHKSAIKVYAESEPYTMEQQKRILRYLRGSVDDMKSTSGYTFSLGSGIFSWASKKQAIVAQSSAEAEYIAAAATSNQAIWLRRILQDMGEKQEEPTTIYCDNKSAIAITKNLVQHNRTKHINIKYHSLREATTREIELKYCSTEEQLANIFTKALPRNKFEGLRMKIGVCHKHIKGEY
ncbi:Retrovirus-related Pol polyprotein from transposon TNT 1-94 [Sesamum angolense]|uniref:Retrovirus-related Pol polyprotein from transposon TNT 1-94 n=1 Tax=Sesamum angolense TaxID=2727404 RepID=A0AAE1T721_9LAMI|nr:Retrovirus-related Pol polyprotein from transposon TNT 1-94 [Sesamum angolense]